MYQVKKDNAIYVLGLQQQSQCELMSKAHESDLEG